MKKTYSIPHIWAILTGLILLSGPTYLIYGVLTRLYLKNEIIPREAYFAFGVFATIGFWIVLLMIYFVKIIYISDKRIKIIFPFKLKSYDYETNQIVKYTINKNLGALKNYETLHFETADNKTYMLNQYEYWNYRKIKEYIENNSVKGEISRFHNIKNVLTGLIIAIFLTIVLIIVFNKFIINVC